MNLIELSPGVYTSEASIVTVGRELIDELKRRLPASPSRRVRFCAHPNTADALHEMMIVVARESYVRPHAHPGKSESFHIVEGEVDVVLFDEAGTVTRVIAMSDRASGKAFYYRTGPGQYHSIRVRTDTVVIHETTNGPFVPGDTTLAPWAPAEDDAPAGRDYLAGLDAAIARLKT